MTKRKTSVILPVVLIVMSVCLILGTTIAYFTDTRGTSTPVNFGKIEISVDEPFSSTVSIKDAIPGTKITDKVAFKKAVDSEDMYVRAKVLFTTTSEDTNIQNLVTELNSYELDIKEYSAGDYAWSEKYGDYIYLVERETPTNAYNITSTDEIVVSDRIELPRELRQSANYAQYLNSIELLVELQAVQSLNVANRIVDLYYVFSEKFDESVDIEYSVANSTSVFYVGDEFSTNKLKIKKKTEVSESVLNASEYDVDYTNYNANTPGDYEIIIKDKESNILTSYNVKVVQPTDTSCFTFNGGAITGLTGDGNALSDIVIPRVYNDGTSDIAVTSIAQRAFMGRDNIVSVIIPGSVTTIENSAFQMCQSLASVTLLEGVESIEFRAFHSCRSLTSIYIPSTVNSVVGFVFGGITYLESIVVDEDNQVYDSRDNCNAIVERTTNKLVLGCKNTIIPSSVTIIAESAFIGCAELTSIIIPNSVTEIEIGAFENCIDLTSITIPDSVTTIERGAFHGCASLTNITISDSVSVVGENLFMNCQNLVNVYFKGSSEQWITWSASIGTNDELINATRYYVYIDESNELVVAGDNAGEEEAVDSGAYTAVIDESDPSEIVATVTFLNGEGDEDDYIVKITKDLTV